MCPNCQASPGTNAAKCDHCRMYALGAQQGTARRRWAARAAAAALFLAGLGLGGLNRRPPGPPPERHFDIHAVKEWQPTLAVRKGQRLRIRATGTWSINVHAPRWTCDAGGITTEIRRVGVLEGRIGATVVSIGTGATLVAPADGVLELECSDYWRPDNGGSVDVAVELDEP